MSAQGKCPGCGAALQFRVATSVVVVCEYCQQVVARGGVNVDDLGKSNMVLALPSPFSVGLTGAFRGNPFTIVGRTQLAHALGGHWNEWYAVAGENKWVWIAEHQGRIAYMREVSAGQAPGIRSIDAATPGSKWFSGQGQYTVAERGVATVYAEEGELPWRAVPNEKRGYVDLSAPGGGFATIDFGPAGEGVDVVRKERRFFVGFEVRLDQLGIAPKPVAAPGDGDVDAELPKVQGSRAIACPQCQAPLELKRPDDTLVVVCGSCGSALSVDEHKHLKFLFGQKLRNKPRIPLGARGRLDAAVLSAGTADDQGPYDVEVVAFVARSVVEDGVTYYFYEYLLATPKDGFLWLVDAEGHWNFFKPVPAADVETHADGSAKYQGKRFTRASGGRPKVEELSGELFWRVNAGDTSNSVDYAAGGRKLTVESTADEVNWTYGFRVAEGPLARAFGVTLGPPNRVSSGESYGYSSSSSSSSSGEASISPLMAFLIIGGFIGLLLLFAASDAASSCHGSGGGGGYSGGSRGGGISFGK